MAYRGWLIYDEAGIKRNKWFAEHLIECASEHGLNLELKVLPTGGLEWRELGIVLRENIKQELMNQWEQDMPMFGIMRAIAPELSLALEEKGIRLFNNALTANIANNKWTTYEMARQYGLPVLETRLVEEVTMVSETERDTTPNGVDIRYPQVIKAVAGHGGSQVYWAKDAADREKVLQEMHSQGLTSREIILQQPCSEPGKDMRVYVLGKEIYQAVIRSSSQDFRSNFSLGGEIVLTQPTVEQRQIVEILHQQLQFDFVGIDFISHNGQWVLNEIEDVVGTRMLYQLTDRDVVQDYLAYIGAQLNGGLAGK